MPQLIDLPTYQDSRGVLTVIEAELNFSIARVFFIYGVSDQRGGHGHIRNKLGLVCIQGHVHVEGQTPTDDFSQLLDNPAVCLLLAPEDWHRMNFSKDAILLVCASEPYAKDDYFYEPYRKNTSY